MERSFGAGRTAPKAGALPGDTKFKRHQINVRCPADTELTLDDPSCYQHHGNHTANSSPRSVFIVLRIRVFHRNITFISYHLAVGVSFGTRKSGDLSRVSS